MTSEPTPSPDTPSPDTWKPNELCLRKREIWVQIGTGIAQALLSVATIGIVLVALVTAQQGQKSLNSTTQNNLQQAQDTQFSTALTSLGSNDVTERIAGLVLLELNASDRLTPTSTAAFGKASAYNYYQNALDIFSGFLHTHGVGSMVTADAGGSTQHFSLGYGTPPPGPSSIDLQYAADEIAKMLDLENQVRAVSPKTPAFDMSDTELYGVNLQGMNLSWVHADMVGIDLRGAVMEGVHLGKLDHAEGSHLQCADLKTADLRGAHLAGANLSGADLRHAHLQGANLAGAKLDGANLYHADLRGANLTGADLQDAYVRGANFSGAQDSQVTFTTMYGPATGLPIGVFTISGPPPIQPPCLTNPSYGDMPVPNATPVSSPSPTPSPSVIARKPTPSPSVIAKKK